MLSDAAEQSACLILDIELDLREGSDSARMTVRSAQPITAASAPVRDPRLCLELTVEGAQAMPEIAALLGPLHGGRSELVLDVPAAGGRARISLGRTFRVDESLRDRLKSLDGISHVAELKPAGSPPLRLVS